MKRRDILAGLALLPLASCGNLRPAIAEPARKFTWVEIDAVSYLQQLLNGSESAREMHDRLIADGWQWDGMDGYSK
jgi:hypothetical protein